jgi:hypothetical protein
MLRAYHPAATATPNANSAVNLSQTAGVSTTPEDWGKDVLVEAAYQGPHLKFPLTKANVEEVASHPDPAATARLSVTEWSGARAGFAPHPDEARAADSPQVHDGAAGRGPRAVQQDGEDLGV